MKKVVNIIGCGFAGAEAALTLADFGMEVHLFDEHFPLESLAYNDKVSQTFLNELLAMGCQSELDNNLTELREKTLQKLHKNEKIKIFNEKLSEISLTEPTIIATGKSTGEQLFLQISGLVGGYNCRKYSFKPLILEGEIEGLQDEKYVYVAVSEEQFDKIFNLLKNFHSDNDCVESWAANGKQLLKAKAFKPAFVNGKIIPICLKFLKLKDKFILENFPTFLGPEYQDKIFSLIPAIKKRNIVGYIEANLCTRVLPVCVNNCFRLNRNENIYLAGAILGFEGQLEAIMSAHIAAVNIACQIFGLKSVMLPNDTLSKNLCDLFISSVHSSSQMIRVCDIIKPANEQKAIKSLTIFKEELNARISRHNNLCSQKRW